MAELVGVTVTITIDSESIPPISIEIELSSSAELLVVIVTTIVVGINSLLMTAKSLVDIGSNSISEAESSSIVHTATFIRNSNMPTSSI